MKFSLIQLRGQSNVARASAHVVRTEEEWRALLRETLGEAGVSQKIDFRSETVIAIFAGQKPTGGYSVRVEKVTEESRAGQPSRVTIHYQVIAPPADALVTQALTYPYTFIRIAKSVDTVEFRPPIEVKPALEAKD